MLCLKPIKNSMEKMCALVPAKSAASWETHHVSSHSGSTLPLANVFLPHPTTLSMRKFPPGTAMDLV